MQSRLTEALQFNQILKMCMSGLLVFVQSDLESGRSCKGKHKGCAKLGVNTVKSCTFFRLISAYERSAALTLQHLHSWWSLLFSCLVSTEC